MKTNLIVFLCLILYVILIIYNTGFINGKHKECRRISEELKINIMCYKSSMPFHED